jgi:integrase/recombinase XerC
VNTTNNIFFQRPTLIFVPMPHMQEYIDELESQNRHIAYVRGKRNALAYLAEFLRGEGLMDPAEIERVHLIRFQAFVNGNPAWKPSYRQQMLKYVRAWIGWCVAIGYIPTDPWIKIKIGRTPKKPKPLEDEDLRLLFAAHRQGAFTMTPFAYHRREMILCLLYGWGLRVHELVALNTANMDVRLDYVTCINKGGNTKNLPYTPEMKKIFTRWSTNRERGAVLGEDALIIASNGRRMPTHHIAKIIYDLGERAGIQVNPHRLRDTCGTHLLDADVPVERVMTILGHATIEQTLAYSRVNDHKVKESLEQAMDPRLHQLFSNTKDLADD